MNWTRVASLVALAALLPRCSDSDTGTAATDTRDVDSGADTALGVDVQGTASCARLPLGAWRADDSDVSVTLEADGTMKIAGEDLVFRLLFERYSPDADIGTFDLSSGFDANFGTCRHCAVAAGTAVNGTVYFADRGTLVTRTDPYDRRFDLSLTNLRLSEVTVDPLTRTSTPVPGGGCVELDDFSVDDVFPDDRWSCPKADWADGAACHCDCTTGDPDCSTQLGETPLPVADCPNGACGFDPVTFTSYCQTTCDWAAQTPCASGTCVYDTDGDGADVCIAEAQRFDPATVGQPCASGSNLQLYCAVSGAFANGYCDAHDVCRSICDAASDCTEPDESCQWFLFPDQGYGYCGPPPPTDG